MPTDHSFPLIVKRATDADSRTAAHLTIIRVLFDHLDAGGRRAAGTQLAGIIELVERELRSPEGNRKALAKVFAEEGRSADKELGEFAETLRGFVATHFTGYF